MAERRADDIPRALERAWADIYWRTSEVPHIVAVVTTGAGGPRLRPGHLVSSTWDPAPHGLPELLVSEEVLRAGGSAVLSGLFHEAAHGVAVSRGVDDLSGAAHRYHTAAYRAAAEHLGLLCRRDRATGWSITELPKPLATRYRGTVRRLDTAITAELGPLAAPPRTAARALDASTGALVRVVCSCGRRLQLPRTLLVQRKVVCRTCRDQFTPIP